MLPWSVDDFSANYDGNGNLTALYWGVGGSLMKTPEPAKSVIGEARTQLEEYLSGKRQIFDLPLKMQGTPFQETVWKTLQKVPFGETVTYSDLAKVIGTHPRAIGSAMGKNPIPIIVPCHRVVGSSGKLTGFSAPGGTDTKALLLAHEQSILK